MGKSKQRKDGKVTAGQREQRVSTAIGMSIYIGYFMRVLAEGIVLLNQLTDKACRYTAK